jgi:fatty acid/phospholipid biosynthesis enzyme
LNNRAVELAQEERAFRAASVGSDQHLNNKAAEIASQRANRAASDRLTGQAEQIQRAEAARLAAQAERFERSAHLEGQANTYSGIEVSNRAAQMAQAEQYVQQQQDRAVTSSGNRAAQMAQAEGYVKQLQDRADSTSSSTDSDDFLPGSHHVSGR